MDEIYSFLREVYFFKDVSDKDLKNFAEHCKVEQYLEGTVVFAENDRAERFYVVMSGEVEVWKDYYSDSSDKLGVHRQGHLFGEMGLVDDLPRSATVVAVTDTKLVYVKREDFLHLVDMCPALSLAIIRSLSSMMRTSNETYVNNLRMRNLELVHTNHELQRAQQQLLRKERLSTLGKLSSLILHDIRNPLSIVKGYTELIYMNADDAAKVRTNCKVVLSEIQRIHAIANELLDYSRGEIRVELSVVEADELFARLEHSLANLFREQGKELVLENFVQRPVLIDIERMQRVWHNLAENARKAMDAGDTLRVHAWNDAHYFYCEFIDTGVGMDEATQGMIFDPFFSKSAKGGTGLGMVIVKSVVEAHGGTVTVQSEESKGTTVRIAIPLHT
ncbi:MAG: histidine kinase [Spirochaetaceae bacterium]|nr:MAG: histidine kinase [Spirochaetaceae bacterium]